MTTKSRFDYEKWEEHWRNWEISCTNAIKDGKFIWSLEGQIKVFQDLRRMMKEMNVSNIR